MGPQYSVIVRKMLRVVDFLPFSADDVHTASSAHGSFGNVLSQLAQAPDLEVTNCLSCMHHGGSLEIVFRTAWSTPFLPEQCAYSF